MKSKGEEPVPLEEYEVVQIDNFLGSTYAQTRDKSIEKTLIPYMHTCPLLITNTRNTAGISAAKLI